MEAEIILKQKSARVPRSSCSSGAASRQTRSEMRRNRRESRAVIIIVLIIIVIIFKNSPSSLFLETHWLALRDDKYIYIGTITPGELEVLFKRMSHNDSV